MKNKPTCKGCKSRYIGCHDECESYKAFRRERDELLDLRNKGQEIENAVLTHKQNGFHKVFIRRNKKGRIL